MFRKTTATMVSLLLVLTLLLAACSSNSNNGPKSSGSNEGSGKTPTTNTGGDSSTDVSDAGVVKPEDLVYPKAFPDVPKAVDYDKSYAYDDMSKAYTIDIMLQGFINQPATKDMIKEFYEKTFNVTINFTNLAQEDLVNKTNVRFASGDAPDVVLLGERSVAQALFKQNQLLDATQILPYMPQMMNYVTEEYKKWATDDGKMIGIPRLPTFPDVWGNFIRQDWLKKLDMEMPKTADELFAYAKAVTEKDPDGNNKADTWFMGAAGAGQGWGMMYGLIDMFGDRSWNVKDNKINHPMLDGTEKAFLEFIKKLNDNKLLAPDWYTIQWEQFKSYSLQNKIGMVNYPGWNLLQEQYSASQNNKDTLQNWAPVPPLTSAMNSDGKLGPGGSPGGITIISKKVGDDPGKMKRIAHFLDAVQYPNKYYWVGNQGGGPEIWPDYTKVTKNDDGTYFYDSDMSKLQNEMKPELKGMMDWQSVGYTLIWERHKYSDEFPYNEPGDKYQDQVRAYPRVTNYDMLLNPDGPTVNRLKDFVQKNEISFVLGKRSFDDWDKYVEEWKKAGGEKLIEQAAEQLGVGKP
ncbi:sugar ABC transporter substrate-binding protein [Paenibacillus baekrokdamisoli]|uniref:Sugar ABC transporter substrate-binding protein n=1 Tax=Paenibacillus baekrokdamisoli TaxID=1712516 RepID=A0A3G9IUY5_9BACL|nr:extracellular solute-binding protein [Paenibacillus baekrokdamisoli]MBB3070814.1 ABC-type glycerol-3-phosphate transport system substrate-binding protein [Paenibacillus baekrokdamisoli]BBH22246.1 sugar ABC transporter substrate-binding protein [Paenibacillus baekrokdamisoli]